MICVIAGIKRLKALDKFISKTLTFSSARGMATLNRRKAPSKCDFAIEKRDLYL